MSPFDYSLKTTENVWWFSDVFKGSPKKTLRGNELAEL